VCSYHLSIMNRVYSDNATMLCVGVPDFRGRNLLHTELLSFACSLHWM